MEAVRFTVSIPRYAAGRALGRVRPSIYWQQRLACLSYDDIDPPVLPGPDWVRVRTRYGGICGTDLSLIRLESSPAASPFSSFPATLGHENVGIVGEVGSDVDGGLRGTRVVVNPLLPCAARGFDDPCDMCRRGDPNLCERFRDGDISPGTVTGFCADTGGSWSPEFVAHRSQLLPVPDGVSDENALLAEPFAVALHAVLRSPPPEDGVALVIGAGLQGLATIAAIRAVQPRCRIVITARYPAQQRLAHALGADVVLGERGHQALYSRIAEETGGEVLRPVIGKPVLRRGVDIVYECVGSGGTIDDALRLARSAGTVVLVGLAGIPRGIDWTPVWMNELRIVGACCYAVEDFEGERLGTIEIALRLMAERGVDLSPLLTHTYPLADYRRALDAVTRKGASGVVRAAFAFDPGC